MLYGDHEEEVQAKKAYYLAPRALDRCGMPAPELIEFSAREPFASYMAAVEANLKQRGPQPG